MTVMLYIEKRHGEQWSDASRLFIDWLSKTQSPETLEPFGFSEGNGINCDGQELFCFCFPDKYGDKISLFDAWAKTTGRRYGSAEGRVVKISDGRSALLPLEPVTPDLPWIQR